MHGMDLRTCLSGNIAELPRFRLLHRVGRPVEPLHLRGLSTRRPGLEARPQHLLTNLGWAHGTQLSEHPATLTTMIEPLQLLEFLVQDNAPAEVFELAP